MTKFIEVNSKTCVNVDSIDWVQKADEGLSCLISIKGVEYPSDIPYASFINMLKTSDAGHDNYHFAG
jgi:hypothetical protein